MSFIVGVDLDEVSGHYIRGIRNFMVARNNVPADQVATLYPDIDTYEFSNWGEDFTTNYRQYHEEAIQAGLFANMEPYEGVSENLWKLNDAGYHIRIITSRFVNHGSQSFVMATTGEFLDKNNIPFRDIAFTSRKTEIYADVYLDDAPKNVKMFREANANYIIFNRSFNQGVPGDRVNNWDECYEMILDKYPLS